MNTDFKNVSASGLIKSKSGKLCGMYVNSTNAGTIKIYDGLSAAAAKASVVLTIDTAPIADGDQVSIGGQVYTWVAALTAATTANEVLIGVSDATALDNLLSAVNKSAGGGTTYGSDTVANAYVTATTNTDTAQTFEAKATGESYNSVEVSSTNEGVTFASATLTGGYDAPRLMNNTITPAVGYHNLGCSGFAKALYVTIAGTALDVTIYTE
jgi:hypothetical protein